MEVWKPIVGYEGIYDVSNTGKVKSLPRLKYCGHPGSPPQNVKERILATRVDRLGYVRVKLSRDADSKLKYVHRLISKSFVDNPNGYKEVNHKDGCKTNNSIDNLEWTTRSKNMQHAFDAGLKRAAKGSDNTSAKLTDLYVRSIRYCYKHKVYTQRELSEKYGVTIANISCIVNYKTWKDVI